MDYPLKMTEQLRPQLQALRKLRGLTQARLGELIGVTQARIVEIEAHPGTVSLQQIMQVLSVLGATLVVRDEKPGSLSTSASRVEATLPASNKNAGTSAPARNRKTGSW